VPLFAHFTYEDWLMLQTRFELWALCISFVKDLDDPDRPGVPHKELGYYYQKYFHKQISAKQFACKDLDEVLNMMKDTVTLNDESLLVAEHNDSEELITFVKLVEGVRRSRQRRIDGGDETARLKFPPPEVQRPPSYSYGTPAVSGLRDGPVIDGAEGDQEPRKVPPRDIGKGGPKGRYQYGKFR